MKKTFIAVCAAALLASCGTTGKMTSVKALAGEWNITEINNKTLDTSKSDNVPFIGFDTDGKRVYGSTGCNRLTGALKADAKTGTIDFSMLGSTRMMCADMQTEQQVLEAMATVKSYKVDGKNTIKLCKEDGSVAMLLKRK